jgi:hypothetical protein
MVLAQLLILMGLFFLQVPTSSYAKTLSYTFSGDLVDEKPLKPFRAAGNEVVESPDWLGREDVLDLLGGNTVTALNKSGTIRWWAYYSNSTPSAKKVIWQNDRGKMSVGIWDVSEDGALCVQWEPPAKKCKRVRISGKTVRFDDHIRGEPTAAVVLYLGDHRNLEGKELP